MWAGVVAILAVLKFSTSPRRLGDKEIRIVIAAKMIIIGVKSLIIK